MKKFLFLFFAAACAAFAQVVVPWSDVDKTGASLADLPTRDFSALQNKPTTISGYAITDAYTKAEVAARRNALAPRQALVLDGSTWPTFSGVPAFGTNDFAVAAWVCPDLTSTRPIACGSTASFALYIQSNGTLLVSKLGTGSTSASSGVVTSAKWTFVAYVRSGTTGTFYINDAAAGTTSDSFDYTGALSRIGSDGGLVCVGSLTPPFVYNRGLTSAEMVALYGSSAPAPADYQHSINDAGATVGASNTSLVTGDNATFASDTGFWALIGGGATISAGKLNVATVGHAARRATLCVTGARYRFNATVSNFTGSGTAIFGSQGGIVYGSVAADGTLSGEFTAAEPSAQFYTTGTAACSFDDFYIFPLGLLCAPEVNAPGNGLVLNDQSGNGAHIVLPTSGVAWGVPSNGVNHIRGTTSTNGNQQLLGAQLVPSTIHQILRIRARSRSGTPTATLGTFSGGSNIVSSIALSTSWKNLTIALSDGVIAGASIWSGSNSTDVIEWDFALEPLAF